MHLGIFGLGVLGLYILDFFGSVVPRPGPVPGVMGGGLRWGTLDTYNIPNPEQGSHQRKHAFLGEGRLHKAVALGLFLTLIRDHS